MQVYHPLDDVTFHAANPYAYPLEVTEYGRILRFALLPGQVVREHMAPQSPVYLLVLKGKGLLSGGDDNEELCGVNTLITLEPGEMHTIRAQDEELIFLAFLHGSSIA
ncbi:MAG: hypothetical protein KDD92_08710 [Caldilineaceae bacterium]|nr:hypothetical protein [Caldilineaceae bacterium]